MPRGLPAVLDELIPSTWHHVEQYANDPIEADHSRADPLYCMPRKRTGDPAALRALDEEVRARMRDGSVVHVKV